MSETPRISLFTSRYESLPLSSEEEVPQREAAQTMKQNSSSEGANPCNSKTRLEGSCGGSICKPRVIIVVRATANVGASGGHRQKARNS